MQINHLIRRFDPGRVKHSLAASKDLWLKTPPANLIHHVPSGIYFSRIRVRGKLIRRSLKTTSLTVAKLRLGDFEKVGRQRVEIQGAVQNGNMRFGDALTIFRGRLQNDAALKSRTKEFRKERISESIFHVLEGRRQIGKRRRQGQRKAE